MRTRRAHGTDCSMADSDDAGRPSTVKSRGQAKAPDLWAGGLLVRLLRLAYSLAAFRAIDERATRSGLHSGIAPGELAEALAVLTGRPNCLP